MATSSLLSQSTTPPSSAQAIRIAPERLSFLQDAVAAGAALAAAAAAAAALALPVATANAGAFRVHQCAVADSPGLAARDVQADLWWVTGGWLGSDCGGWAGRMRFDAPNHRLLYDSSMTARLAVPGSMPRTSMRTVWLDWQAMPQAPSTDPAYLVVSAGATRVLEAASGSGTAPGSAERREVPAGTRVLDFVNWCSPVNGPGWCNWPGHLLELRGLTLELEEGIDPAASASGALLDGRPQAGVTPLELDAADGDSGVRSVAASLGGVAVGQVVGRCRDDRLPPCPPSLHGVVDVDTTRVPDGPRRLRLVVTDAAGNMRTVDAGAITVANQPAAPDAPPGPPPGTGGGGSGGAGGGSDAPHGAPPPRTGAPFPPNPLAGRGHFPNGRNADENARVSAWLERGHRRSRAVTAPVGVRVRIRGRVVDAEGRPIAAAALALIERVHGSWRAATGVRTRADGRFTTFTRLGPSRVLRFVYYAFGDSTRGRRSPDLRLTVRRGARW
jgi:hypothetical protein